jgi:hypothetical protein
MCGASRDYLLMDSESSNHSKPNAGSILNALGSAFASPMGDPMPNEKMVQVIAANMAQLKELVSQGKLGPQQILQVFSSITADATAFTFVCIVEGIRGQASRRSRAAAATTCPTCPRPCNREYPQSEWLPTFTHRAFGMSLTFRTHQGPRVFLRCSRRYFCRCCVQDHRAHTDPEFGSRGGLPYQPNPQFDGPGPSDVAGVTAWTADVDGRHRRRESLRSVLRLFPYLARGLMRPLRRDPRSDSRVGGRQLDGVGRCSRSSEKHSW